MKVHRLLTAVNPISQLGKNQDSLLFPLFATFFVAVVTEFYAYHIAHNPHSIDLFAIFGFLGLIIYFSFRNGISGGSIATGITILYYIYIVASRHYAGELLNSAITSIVLFGALYAVLTVIIGGLKEVIDRLIVKETQAREKAEEERFRLQSVIQQLPVGVLIVDKDGKNILGNRQIENILGGKMPDQLRLEPEYRSAHVYSDNRSLPSQRWPIVRSLTKGIVINAEEMEYTRSDKKKVIVRVNAAPIKNRKKEIIAAVSTLYDVTREKTEEHRKDDFVNMVSHELKTPITTIRLYLEALINQTQASEDIKLKKMLQNTALQVAQLQNLVGDLLDVSRLQTGKLQFNKEKFYLDDLVSEVVRDHKYAAPRHTIRFVQKKHIAVVADKFRITQVLSNLLTNATKYSPERTTIDVAIQKIGNTVVVSVQDFGIGIAKSEQHKVFDRLYQVNNSKENTFPGFGMGLYISREIIKRHRGRIWVNSIEKKGSTFYFSLPLR